MMVGKNHKVKSRVIIKLLDLRYMVSLKLSLLNKTKESIFFLLLNFFIPKCCQTLFNVCSIKCHETKSYKLLKWIFRNKWVVNHPTWMCGPALEGSTVGIVGMGSIGCKIAQRIKSFDIGRLLYSNRRESKAGKVEKIIFWFHRIGKYRPIFKIFLPLGTILTVAPLINRTCWLFQTRPIQPTQTVKWVNS